ncbi:factor of DNA methylation 2-like [Gastrolobium bilobum]|uniref:factor of DNA methylation 2-like n=1 Tax=Gastrolobium bilobum TaxID=150636 RepID=UPI002AB014AA|nr:factor of DNA methylation 2-like [Gastrolobium bilobum]
MEALNMQRVIIGNLQNEIEYKNNKIMEMEHKHRETLAAVHKLVIGLTEHINSKERSMLEMECKYIELDNLHEGCHKELQHMKVMNSNMNHDMEGLTKELGKLTKQLEESKALNDQQQRNFIEEIQKLRFELQDQSHVESGGNLNTQITAFRNELKDKMEDLEHLHNLYSSLIVKERQYKQELLDAREESVNSLQDICRGRSQLRIKRMGELDPKPFRDLCLQRYSHEQWQDISAKLCSSWEENLNNPAWHPFKRIEVNGNSQELDENDEKLKGLRNEYGGEFHQNSLSSSVSHLILVPANKDQ